MALVFGDGESEGGIRDGPGAWAWLQVWGGVLSGTCGPTSGERSMFTGALGPQFKNPGSGLEARV